MKYTGEKIFIKILSPDDVTKDYVSWMNDPEITQFLESRWSSYTYQDIVDYVKDTNKSSNNYLFGIFDKENNLHIGNIKLGNINQLHRFGDLGLLIGNKNYWGKGCATEAIDLITFYAFNHANLNKVLAGIYENNQGSYRAFIKCGYKDAGRLRKNYFCDGVYVDKILVEKLKEEV